MGSGIRLARICIAALGLALAACDSGVDYIPAGEILAAPDQYEGKEVRVRGVAHAATRLPFADMRTFLLEQNGIDLLIITEGPLPEEGEKVALRGIVHSAAILNGQALGLRIREVERF